MALAAKSFSDLITFTRASTAGYYGSDGLYKTAPSGSPRTGTYADYKPAEITQQNILTYSSDYSQADWTKLNSFVQTNLLTYSEQFDNATAWSTSSATRTPNTVAGPDGNTTADTITAVAVVFGNYVRTGYAYVASTTYTLSVYAKAGTASRLGLRLSGQCVTAGDAYAWFDLSTGAFTTITPLSGTVVSGSATSAGNGWWRCSLTYTTPGTAPAGTTDFAIVNASGSTNYTPAGTETIYLWGAQLVQGSVAGDYRATTSAALPVLYADPLGTTLAMKLCEDATAASQHRLIQQKTIAANSLLTDSFYLKAGERSQVRLINYDGTTNFTFAFVNLLTGQVVTSGATGTATSPGVTVTPAVNGWFRVAVTGSLASTTRSVYLNIVSTSEVYSGDGSSGIYVFGGQLNDGATALPYLATTATGGHATAIGAKRGFLVEESRTNLLLRSNDWSANWGLTNVTQTAAQAIGPDGTLSMTKLAVTATAATVCIQAFAATSTALVYSIYAKQGSGATEANVFAVYNNTTTSNLATLIINYATGVLTQSIGTGATAENVGSGIWRISIPVSAGITVGNSLQVYSCFAGSVETVGRFAYVYGGQVEAGAFATSYIPTTTAQVTRAGDVPRIDTVSPWYNTTAGTWYVEARTQTYPRYLVMDASGAAKYPVYVHGIAGAIATYDGTTTVATSNFTTANTTFKAAVSFGNGVAKSVLNGGTVASNSYSGSFASITSFLFGNSNPSGAAGTGNINGHLRVIRFYPLVFTDTAFSALTA